MTYSQFVAIQAKMSCLSIEKNSKIDTKNNSNRRSREVTQGNIDVHALQTTIHNQQTMINYLFNNSINATNLADAIDNYHSHPGPILTSWRDLFDLFLLCLVLIIFIYFLLCRAGFAPCHHAISFIFKPVIDRLQQQQQLRQQHLTPTTVSNGSIQQNRTQSHSPINSIFSDGIRK